MYMDHVRYKFFLYFSQPNEIEFKLSENNIGKLTAYVKYKNRPFFATKCGLGETNADMCPDKPIFRVTKPFQS